MNKQETKAEKEKYFYFVFWWKNILENILLNVQQITTGNKQKPHEKMMMKWVSLINKMLLIFSVICLRIGNKYELMTKSENVWIGYIVIQVNLKKFK